MKIKNYEPIERYKTVSGVEKTLRKLSYKIEIEDAKIMKLLRKVLGETRGVKYA